MLDWGVYETRLGVSGVCERDRVVSREREIILRRYMASPALKTVSINGEYMYLLINSTQTPSEKVFNTLPDEVVNIGDIILWQEMHWLVTQVDFDDEISRNGRMVQCNRQICWQNPNTHKIVERWCLITKPYTSGVDEGYGVSTSNREFKVQLPFDGETRLIDLGKRFMLEIIDGKPRTYGCISVDQQSNKYQDIDGGFIVINLKQDESGQADDRPDLMICNYEDPPDILDPSPSLLRCEINGRDSIRVGVSRKYTAIFYDENGGVVDGVEPVWSVEPPDGCADKVSWEQDDGVIEIGVTDATMVGRDIVVYLMDADGLYAPATINVGVVGLYG